MDLRSAWIPAPPEGSVPAMERTLGTRAVRAARGVPEALAPGAGLVVGAHAGAVGCSATVSYTHLILIGAAIVWHSPLELLVEGAAAVVCLSLTYPLAVKLMRSPANFENDPKHIHASTADESVNVKDVYKRQPLP